MKIVDVKAYPLVYKFSKPIKASFNPPILGFYNVLVEISTDEGITGYGECDAQAGFAESIARIIDGGKIPEQGGLKRILIGRDPFDVEVLWENMFNVMRYYDSQYGGFYIEAISGIDIALWDIIGKTLKYPIHKLIGGSFRNRLKTYGLVAFGTPEEMARDAMKKVEAGYKVIKVKIGQGKETLGVYTTGKKDIDGIREIRKTVGDGIEIGVDANCAFEVATAKKVGKQLEDYGVRWFEEPIPPDNLDGYVELCRSLDLYIAAGENFFTPYGFKDFIEKSAIDIVQPDVKRCGGITAERKIAQMAWTHDILYQPHTTFGGIFNHAAELQVSATIPNFISMEFAFMGFAGCQNKNERLWNPFAEDPEIITEPITEFEDGYLKIPNKPGLGVQFNKEVMLEKYLIK